MGDEYYDDVDENRMNKKFEFESLPDINVDDTFVVYDDLGRCIKLSDNEHHCVCVNVNGTCYKSGMIVMMDLDPVQLVVVDKIYHIRGMCFAVSFFKCEIVHCTDQQPKRGKLNTGDISRVHYVKRNRSPVGNIDFTKFNIKSFNDLGDYAYTGQLKSGIQRVYNIIRIVSVASNYVLTC